MARVIINKSGTKIYHNDQGEWHREDGPAVIYSDGSYEWRIHVLLRRPNRKDGPTIYSKAGVYNWYNYSYDTRREGPTVDYPNGFKRWIINGLDAWPILK